MNGKVSEIKELLDEVKILRELNMQKDIKIFMLEKQVEDQSVTIRRKNELLNETFNAGIEFRVELRRLLRHADHFLNGRHDDDNSWHSARAMLVQSIRKTEEILDGPNTADKDKLPGAGSA